MTQLAYYWDCKDFYTHCEPCTTDPLESARRGREVYVLGANGCLDAPIVEGGKWPRRVNGAWVNVENHVGENGFVNGVPTEIKEYGALPDGWSTEPLEPTTREKLLGEISALESQPTPRRLREAALSDEGKAWLQNLDNQIAAKRAELAGL